MCLLLLSYKKNGHRLSKVACLVFFFDNSGSIGKNLTETKALGTILQRYSDIEIKNLLIIS